MGKAGEVSSTSRNSKRSIAIVLATLVACYAIIGLFMRQLGFQLVQGDTAIYWQDSQTWQSPFNPLYMPLYPAVIALVNALTLGLPDPGALMSAINLAGLSVCGWLIYLIARSSGASETLATASAVLFGLWPLVGLPFTVFPLADIPAMAFFLAGVYLLQRSRLWAGAGLIGLSLLAHKALWPFGGLVMIAFCLMQRPRISPAKMIGLLGAAILPLTILWAAGWAVHGSPLWLVSGNIELEMASNSHLPVLDGAIGTFLQGGVKGIGKGAILASFALLAVGMAYACIREKPPAYLAGAAICVVVVLWWLILNQYEIWSVTRFSRLLILPLVWVAAYRLKDAPLSGSKWKYGMAASLGVLLLSQFIYAWYMVRVFYA